jgi:hypothetical protein
MCCSSSELTEYRTNCNYTYKSFQKMKKINSILIQARIKFMLVLIILCSTIYVSATTPGGVSATLWFRADNGVITGSNLIWINQGTLGTTNNANQSTVVKQPELVQGSFNFNPTLKFYGSNTMNFNDVGLTNGGNARSFIIVASNSSVDANKRDIYHYGTPVWHKKSDVIV